MVTKSVDFVIGVNLIVYHCICHLEVTMEKMHVREQQLRDFNKRIVEAMDEFRLHDCMHALDELICNFNELILMIIRRDQF